jgi:hypothetical protein
MSDQNSQNDIKQVIDQTKDYTLIKSGAGRTLVLVKKGRVIKGKVLCQNFMEKLPNNNLTLLDEDEIRDNNCPENIILQKIIETTKTEPTDKEVKDYKRKIPQNLLNSITQNVAQSERNQLLKAITLVNPENLKKIKEKEPKEIKDYVNKFSNLLKDIQKGREKLEKINHLEPKEQQQQQYTKEFNTNMVDLVRNSNLFNKNQEDEENNTDFDGGKYSRKKIKRDKLGRFIKRKTRKSWY